MRADEQNDSFAEQLILWHGPREADGWRAEERSEVQLPAWPRRAEDRRSGSRRKLDRFARLQWSDA